MKLYTALNIALIAALAMVCHAEEPVVLKYKFDNDKPIAYEMIQSMNQVQAIQGQIFEITSQTNSVMKSELIKTNSDGSVLISNTTESVHFKMSAPGIDLDYDSTNPADNGKTSDPTIASVAGFVGMQVQLLISSEGSVLDVPNINELTTLIDAVEDPAIQAVIRPMMNKDSLIAMNDINYNLLPTQAVEVGDQWNRVFQIPFEFGTMTTTFDLTLDSVENGIAMISITGSMTMPPISQQSITMSMSKAQVAGSMKFNIKDGVPDHFELVTESGMIGVMDGMPEPILEMTMTQTVKNTRLDK